MRCTINRMALVQALNKLEPAIPLKSMYLQEIYYHVLVQAQASGITLSATNGDVRVSIRVVTSMLVLESGACAVNYAQLVEALKAFPRKADLLIWQEEQGLVLSMGPLSKTVAATAASGFPTSFVVPSVGESYETEEWDGTFSREYPGQIQTSAYTYQVLQVHTQRLVMERDALLEAVGKVAFAAAADDSRPVLMAVYTLLQNDELTLVAGDGFRLAEHRTHVAQAGSWEHGVLIWARHFVRGLQLLTDQWETRVSVEAHAMTKQLVKRNGYPVTNQEPRLESVLIRLIGEHEVVEIRPIAGSYPPNYQSMIPQDSATLVTCNREALVTALEEMAPAAREVSNKVTWYTQGTSLRLEVEVKKKDTTDDTKPVAPLVRLVPAACRGDEVGFALNCAFVLSMLRAITTPGIVLALNGKNKPVLLRPDGDAQTSYVIMPMIFDR